MKIRWKKAAILMCLVMAFCTLTGFAPSRMVVNSRAVLRQGPSIRAARVGTLEAEEVVWVVSATETGWYELEIGQTPVYVKQNYLTTLPFKINALGDSMTVGAVVQDNNNIYSNVAGILCEADEVRNYGYSGTTIAGIMPENFVDRALAMEQDASLVLVMGGTNDFYYNVPLGTDFDRTYDTFYGALHVLCIRLKEMYPDSDIVFITPLHRSDEFGEVNKNGNSLEQYAWAMAQVCSEYGIPVIDVYHEETLDFRQNMAVYMPDGLHPNDLGQMAVGYYVADQLAELGIVYGEREEADEEKASEAADTTDASEAADTTETSKTPAASGVPKSSQSSGSSSATRIAPGTGMMGGISSGDGWRILDSVTFVEN